MAEAPTSESSEQPNQSRIRYFCHQCSESIYPNIPDYTCPRCESGFIEELTAAEEDNHDLPVSVPPFMDILNQTFLDSLRQHGQNEASSNGPTPNLTNPIIRPRPRRFPPPRGQFNPETAGVEFIINHLLQTLTHGGLLEGMPMNFIHLHGNPGDYAWGDSMDSIITQLLNQLEGSGPPPASKEQMEKLSKRTITQADVEKTLQCAVCFEDFVKDESVRCLPCEHVYHDDCIYPWLKNHGSCPICRKDLEGKDTSSAGEENGEGTSGTANGFVDDQDDQD